jgi:hypothetical protein
MLVPLSLAVRSEERTSRACIGGLGARDPAVFDADRIAVSAKPTAAMLNEGVGARSGEGLRPGSGPRSSWKVRCCRCLKTRVSGVHARLRVTGAGTHGQGARMDQIEAAVSPYFLRRHVVGRSYEHAHSGRDLAG